MIMSIIMEGMGILMLIQWKVRASKNLNKILAMDIDTERRGVVKFMMTEMISS